MISEEQFNIFLDNIKLGLSITDCCKGADISREIYYKWLENSPEKTKQINDAELELKKRCLKIIQRGSLEDAKWAAWLLERKWPDEYGRKDRIALGNENNEPLKINITETIIEKIKQDMGMI